jgi:Predicted integral membrane protein
MKKKIIILISWSAVFLWMLLIFCFSSQVVEKSRMLSEGIVITSIDTVEKVTPVSDFDMEQLEYFVRKNAHFFNFLVLGILVVNAKRRSGFKGLKWFIAALVFCILYAVSDEIHQLYVPGRGGQLQDVLIDSAGVLAGSTLYVITGKIRSKCLLRKI